MHNLTRLVDANFNRSREGLRVCEDIARFIMDDRTLTRSFKSLRQRLTCLKMKLEKSGDSILLKSRDVKRDIGKDTSSLESKRRNLADIFRANIERVKESLRVLEEISKLLDKNLSQDFKKIRFVAYELEKKSAFKLETLLHNR